MDEMEISQELAKRLLMEGGILTILNVPPGVEFGIDMKSWNTGERFKGVKMIPPGVHYVHISAVNKHGDSAPRIGFIYNFKQSEIVLKYWDNDKEDLCDKEVTQEEIDRLRGDLLNLDRFLGHYPFEIWNKWRKLTNFINDDLISKITPASGKIQAALELISIPKNNSKTRVKLRPSTLEEKEEELLPNLQPLPGTALRWTDFPERDYPENSTPAEITRHSLDSSYILRIMLNKYDSPLEYLGELQFSFICFLIGHSLEAFEHWKKMISLLCKSESAIHKQPQIYSNFILVLQAQLLEIPEDFLVDIVASNNFIYHHLRRLFRNVFSSSDSNQQLKQQYTKFQGKLTNKFGWDFSDVNLEDDDELPVIVQL